MRKLKKAISLFLCASLLLSANPVQASDLMPEDTIAIEELITEDEPQQVESDVIHEQEREDATEIKAEEPQQEERQQEQPQQEQPQQPDTQPETTRYQETVNLLPPEEDEFEWDGELAIYWNPEGREAFKDEQETNASPSAATTSNSFGKTLKDGSDHADGLTPDKAVKGFATAVRRARGLSRQMDVEISDITIYAMKPMVISEGVLYVADGNGVSVTAWAERDDKSDLVFAVDGGQLILNNIVLTPNDGGTKPEEAEMIYVKSGKVQLGEQVESYGKFVLDYKEDQKQLKWSSTSNASASSSEVNRYTAPIIELNKKFDAVSNYYIELNATGNLESVTAVNALFSDTSTADEFMELFTLVETEKGDWSLTVEERIDGVLRDTTEEQGELATDSEITPSEIQKLRSNITRNEDLELTQKSLVALRAPRASSDVVYWSPGPGFSLGPNEEDQYFGQGDGSTAYAPVKTWTAAKEAAKTFGTTTIVCMQTLTIGPGAEQYIPFENNEYRVEGETNVVYTLAAWDNRAVEAFKIPDGQQLYLKNLILQGQSQSGLLTGTGMVECAGGQVILEEKIKTIPGYIKITLEDNYRNSKVIPVVVKSDTVEDINLGIGGIADDISWRYYDIVAADGELLDLGEEAAGQELLENIHLEAVNTTPSAGTSEFAWILRQDSDEDKQVGEPVNRHHLELYTTYYFDAVYLDGTRGHDLNFGATCRVPVKTFAKAAEILKREIIRSGTDRANAASEEERQKISIPKTIYICGEVTVDGSELWELPDVYLDGNNQVILDENNQPIKIEIKTHLVNGSDPHSTPNNLIHVKESTGNLTLGKNIFIRSLNNDKNSYTAVVDEGGTLNLTANAVVTGLKSDQDLESRTDGTNIIVGHSPLNAANTSKGTLNLASDWTGSINGKLFGVKVYHADSKMQMAGGSITNHKNYVDYGAGVLIDQAEFTMTGGTISENTALQNGAGVYLTNGARFKMQRGSILKNVSTRTASAVKILGVGVYVGANCEFEMGVAGEADNLCEIAEQYASCVYDGVGVHIAATAKFTMHSGTIRDNVGVGASAIGNSNAVVSTGAGISNFGTLTINKGVISGNGVVPDEGSIRNYHNLKGGGIYLGGVSQTVSNAHIYDNRTGRAYSSVLYYQSPYSGGGGIAVAKDAVIKQCLIENNRSVVGAGIAVYTGTAVIEGESESDPMIIKNNVTTSDIHDVADQTSLTLSGYGGGIYALSKTRTKYLTVDSNRSHVGGGVHNYSTSSYVNAIIKNNFASSYGGGIANHSSFFIKDSDILSNQVLTTNLQSTVDGRGGGIENRSSFYGSGLIISGNTADKGGAISSLGNFYLSDKDAVKTTTISGNEARLGGGFYLTGNSTTLQLDKAVVNTNLATGNEPQGNNVYLYQSNTSDVNLNILSGTFGQPSNSESGVYNFYLTSDGNSIGIVSFDPDEVLIGGDNPIYLNSTNNYLRYYKTPATGLNMPVDVNEEVFVAGSVIIKPSGVTNVRLYYPSYFGQWLESVAYINQPVNGNMPLMDATENMLYPAGGKIPDRLRLGEFRDSQNTSMTNVVLLGEGVYIRGDGDDNNTGESPKYAVRTFPVALQRLRTQIDGAKSSPKGTSPFIYICGTVPVSASAIWELDYDDPVYISTNYITYEESQGRAPERAQVKRFTSFVKNPTSSEKAPMIKVTGSGTRLTMSKIIINGMADSVITKDQSDKSPIVVVESGTELILQEQTNIRNNYANMIDVYGKLFVNSSMSDNLSPALPEDFHENKQIEVTRGDGAYLYDGAYMEMNGYARVNLSKRPDLTISMNNFYTQTNVGRGVVIVPGAELMMKNSSSIEFTGAESPGDSDVSGIVMGASTDQGKQALLTMKDNTAIKGCYQQIGIDNYNVKIEMQDSAKLVDGVHGVRTYYRGVNDISFIMDGTSSIENQASAAFYFYDQNITTNRTKPVYVSEDSNDEAGKAAFRNRDKILIHLKGNSSVKNNGYGLYALRFYSYFDIIMEGHSTMEGNGTGAIYESSYGTWGINVTMSDYSRIGSSTTRSQNYGIYLNPAINSNISGVRTGDYQFTLKDHAMIGGEGYYGQGSIKQGNRYNGIVSGGKPMMLTMTGNSKICYNGYNTSQQSSAGVNLNRSGIGTLATGDTKIKLSNNASICNNRAAGIYSEDKVYLVNNVNTYYHYEAIELYGNSSVISNGAANQFMYNSDLYLYQDIDGSPTLGNQTATTTSPMFAAEMYGALHMDGSATVNGMLRLWTKSKPITLLSAVPRTDPEGKFRLYLLEKFIGEVVVQPKTGNPVLPSVVSELAYFNKADAQGLAASKELLPEEPNIILDGEAHVYLAGNGNDDNTGTSPTNAVRTFARAKAILEGVDGGRYRAGSNILICNSEVVVLQGDEDWSFDSGVVHNSQTNTTWTPLVQRYEQYRQVLIGVYDPDEVENAAAYVEFKDITIDGLGAEAGSTVAFDWNREKAILRVKSGEAILGQNAVLQNNRSDYSYGSVAYESYHVMGALVNQDGILTIDGGTIQGMVLENINNSYKRLDLGVAICNYGKVEIKDGTIQNNKIQIAPGYNFTNIASTILNKGSGQFIFRNGTISNNEILPESNNNTTMFGSAVTFLDMSYGLMKGGDIIDNIGNKGPGIYYQSNESGKKFEIEGGRIRNNVPVHGDAIGKKAGIYIAGDRFTLKGGGCTITDGIYLHSIKHILTLSGNIEMTGSVIKKYHIYLNYNEDPDPFVKGSVVVQPDGNFMQDITQFLINFEVHQNPFVLDRGHSNTRAGGTINGIKESQCILLMQAVFIDSGIAGGDTNNGLTPQTAVATFARAKQIGESPYDDYTRDYFIIYISGKVTPEMGETWSLENASYMCRYTGFTVYDAKGSELNTKQKLYTGYLIEPKRAVKPEDRFTLENIQIYGRRNIDDTKMNGESIIKINKDITVTVKDGTVLARNYNVGNYLDGEVWRQLSSMGGAVTVAPGGLLEMQGGIMSDVSAEYGSAIYQDADTKAPEDGGTLSFGHVQLSGSPLIKGNIYLNGQIDRGEAYLEVDTDYIPFTEDGNIGLSVRVHNDYSGRPVVLYMNGATPPGDEKIAYYKLDDSIIAVYDFDRSSANPYMLTLQLRQILYINGQSGDNNKLGNSPENAVKTLDRIYEIMASGQSSAGALVFVVDTIEINSHISIINESYIENGESYYTSNYVDHSNPAKNKEIESQIYLKRYSRPDTSSLEGFMTVDDNLNSLFIVKDGATLDLNGVYMDGHSERYASDYDYLCAEGVESTSPLVTVKPGGKLISVPITSDYQEGNKTRVPMFTLFSNNFNKLKKDEEADRDLKYKVGKNVKDIVIYEGSSAGIEILSNQDAGKFGEVVLEATEFRNLKLADNVTGGSDIYQNGKLNASKRTVISGSVFLEGLGDEDNRDTSRFIFVGEYGTPFARGFDTKMRDPYITRKVVEFDWRNDMEPSNSDAGTFALEEYVNKYFVLRKRTNPSEKNILELTVPRAVYVDGQNGNENAEGYYPTMPVKSLEKAYEKLKNSGGKVIYIMDTVDISTKMTLTGKTYQSEDNGTTTAVDLFVTTDHVDIRRYVRPVAGLSGPDYDERFDADTFYGTLINIKSGGSLTLRDHVYFDGHAKAKNQEEYTNEFKVEQETKVTAPLIHVEAGGLLNLDLDSKLEDNDNNGVLSGGEERIVGGAINNDGEVLLRGGLISGNKAEKGAGIYQNGRFEITTNPERIVGQKIYLTTVNTGDASDPVWGEDHIINTAVLLPNTVVLDVDMDRPEAGRPVVFYTADDGVDVQHDRYALGSMVPSNLFLVENASEDSLLELQDWRVFKVAVPEEIFLVIQKAGGQPVVASDAASDGLNLNAPNYTVTNGGNYKVKVSLAGFINQNTAAGITAHDQMNLVATADLATAVTANEKDLYLAIEGISGTKFSGLGSTSLHSYGTDGSVITEMGVLNSGESGKFTFKGAASRQFMNKYDDSTFPFYGALATAENRIAHIRHLNDGVTSANNARAKYKLTYRLELVREQPSTP